MVQIANPAGRFPTLNGSLPCEGTLAMPINYDFSAFNAYQTDFSMLFQGGSFTTLQTVWIDNSASNSVTQIVIGSTGQTITAPPKSQGFYAMLLPKPFQFSVQSSGAVVVPMVFLNYYIPPFVWNTSSFSSTGLPQIDIPAIDAIIVNGALNTNINPFTSPTATNGSGTITTGGTKQSALAANASRKRFILANPDTATETLYFSYQSANGVANIPLAPGMIWDEGNITVVGAQLYVEAATTGHAYTLYSY